MNIRIRFVHIFTNSTAALGNHNQKRVSVSFFISIDTEAANKLKMYGPPPSDSDSDDFDGMSFGNEFEKVRISHKIYQRNMFMQRIHLIFFRKRLRLRHHLENEKKL